MKGKIAVITGCHWCPYKAFDNHLGQTVTDDKTGKQTNEIAYCGYHKVGYDGSQTRIENALSIQTDEGVIMPENPIDMPDDCPLPEGDDKQGKMTMNCEGEKCPICGAKETEAMTPRTIYECGSSDYDQRPNTFKQSDNCKLREENKK